MAIIRILSYPDPKLQRTAHKVKKIDDRVKQIIADMFETHYNATNCAALAATQLDIADPVPYITVIDFSKKKDSPLCIINGNIIERSGELKEEEACMSVFPDTIYAPVTRATNIKVEYMDEVGNNQILEADGFMAKCIQHELDHLDGKIYLDRLSKLKRTLLEKKINTLLNKKV